MRELCYRKRAQNYAGSPPSMAVCQLAQMRADERGMLRRTLVRSIEHGLLKIISPAELLYWQLRLRGMVEPELAVFPQSVRRDTVAIDVGANVGLYTLAFLRQGASVVAIEPLARYTGALEVLSKRFGRLTICQAAASDVSGHAMLSVPLGDTDMGGYSTLRPFSGRHHAELVRTVRLDDLGLSNVSAIKIDVEGHERSVMNGALSLIRMCRPVLMIEIEQRYLSEPVSAIIRMVENLGYEAFFLKSGSLRPAKDFTVETHQQVNHRPYINNFIFKPINSEFAA